MATISEPSGNVILTISHTCVQGDTTIGYNTLDATDVSLHYANVYGLATVQGFNMINWSFSSGTAIAFGVSIPLTGGQLPGVNGGSPTSLPAGTTNLTLEASETTTGESLNARVNAQVTDSCDLATSFDPVSANLYLSQSGEVKVVFNHLSQNDKYVNLKNGTPGLRYARVIVNGTVFPLNGLANGDNQVVEISSALTGGTGNTVVIEGFGTKGAGASVSIGEIPADPTLGSLQVSAVTASVSTFVALPTLQITQTGNQAILSWPMTGPDGEDFTPYQLQTSASGAPGTWGPVATVPTSSTGELTVPVTPGGSAQFYQLANPTAP
jgi:hypothetical protein